MSQTSSEGHYQRLRDIDLSDAGPNSPRYVVPGSLSPSRQPGAVYKVSQPPSSSTSSSTYASKAMFRQKKGRKMCWLLIHNNGESQTVQMDKRQLIQVMGLDIPMRDLRLMDPALATWEGHAQILVRDNALVVSSEHVRIIITCDKVIFPLDFEKTENFERFIKNVEAKIRERPTGAPSLATTPSPQPLDSHSSFAGGLEPGSAVRLHRVASVNYNRDPELLPFELNMLEAALGEITRHYAQQTSSLETIALPALDALMHNCNSANLERVRKIKTQHQRLQGRLQGLREVMERYMEDDQDMYRMCLSKWRDHELEAGSDNTLLLGRREGLLAASSSLPRRSITSYGRSPPGFMERFQSLGRRDKAGDDSSSSSSSNGADYHDLLEVENLLESYFMLVDGTVAKLVAIGEYIDDTEDFINIELDYNRNRLLRIEILLTVATFALAVYNLVAGESLMSARSFSVCRLFEVLLCSISEQPSRHHNNIHACRL
eukprot:GHRR01018445.1.p1 GENE.GHRR01018445.1~~GHRR01018445.1.p1  ORF type:complete len:489 (+),score=107.86 GHRR01018445.1:272-1738(+)